LSAPGLISAFVFRRSGQAQPWQTDKVLDLDLSDGWVRADFNLSDTRAHHWLSERQELSRQAQDVLTSHDEHAYLRDDGSCLNGMVADLVRNVRGQRRRLATCTSR
jgi:hypothetical protein